MDIVSSDTRFYTSHSKCVPFAIPDGRGGDAWRGAINSRIEKLPFPAINDGVFILFPNRKWNRYKETGEMTSGKRQAITRACLYQTIENSLLSETRVVPDKAKE